MSSSNDADLTLRAPSIAASLALQSDIHRTDCDLSLSHRQLHTAQHDSIHNDKRI
jgi:hypothetical protein